MPAIGERDAPVSALGAVVTGADLVVTDRSSRRTRLPQCQQSPQVVVTDPVAGLGVVPRAALGEAPRALGLHQKALKTITATPHATNVHSTTLSAFMVRPP